MDISKLPFPDTYKSDRAKAFSRDWFVGVGFRLLAFLSSKLARKALFNKWQTPRKQAYPKQTLKVLSAGKKYLVKYNRTLYMVYSLGRGPKILLIHDEHGSASDWVAYAENLANAGFQVIYMDMPAHGKNTQSLTTLFECDGFIRAIDDYFGCQFEAVITQGVGFIWLMNAIKKGVVIDKLICIDPIFTCRDWFVEATRKFDLSPLLLKDTMVAISGDYGSNFWYDCSPMAIAKEEADLPLGLVLLTESEGFEEQYYLPLVSSWPTLSAVEVGTDNDDAENIGSIQWLKEIMPFLMQ